jgi:hypothetical protein
MRASLFSNQGERIQPIAFENTDSSFRFVAEHVGCLPSLQGTHMREKLPQKSSVKKQNLKSIDYPFLGGMAQTGLAKPVEDKSSTQVTEIKANKSKSFNTDTLEEQVPEVSEARNEVKKDPFSFTKIMEREGLKLATEKLFYFAHWITPELSPIRYDARFFCSCRSLETGSP